MGGFGDFFKGAGGGLISGAFDLVGGGISAITGNKAQDREYERQKEFAQNGIRWRVDDAKAAGIHPIFAIGANVPTYSPQAAVGTDFGLSKVGQSIGRAIEAKQTADERREANFVSNEIGRAQADYYRAAAENQRMQADYTGQRAVRDALDSMGRDFIGGMGASSDRRIRTQPGQPPSLPRSQSNRSQGGVQSDDFVEEVTFVRNPKGQLWSLRNTQDFHDMNEDVPIAEIVPWLNGITWDLRAKLTREPIMVKGKWYAFNDNEGYVPINIKTYKPYWKKWFTEKRSQELNRMYNPKTGARGIRSIYGG